MVRFTATLSVGCWQEVSYLSNQQKRVIMSAKTFGPRFIPSDFIGPLATHYPDRADLFQQLVGSLFKEIFSQRASLSATKGKDGAIDVFVEKVSDDDELFLDLYFPLIVECKEHDDTLDGVVKNIFSARDKLLQKLAQHAESGWDGDYQPWKNTRGYLYCVSAVLKQDVRERLTNSIRDFFLQNPNQFSPPIENILVRDWNDIAELLNRYPRLADMWLGTDLPCILGYDDYKKTLSGFKSYLMEDNLPFVFPDKNDPADPQNIYEFLSNESEKPGILLIGAGGSGKTRTCFEVATIAHNNGWRVLHVMSEEPQITLSILQDIVLQGKTKTLLVIDYLDKMGALDFGAIKSRLIPEATGRGIQVSLLANARPAMLQKIPSGNDALFEKRTLDITSRSLAIASKIQASIAPKALLKLGQEKISELCGNRPIIGMFIARELERYAQENRLTDTIIFGFRQGDLKGWIRKRLEEDKLLEYDVSHPLVPSKPQKIMISVAAAFAATPLQKSEIVSVIEKTLVQSLYEGDADEIAPQIVDSLIQFGWLEDNGFEVVTAHDVITDELLESTLYDDYQSVRPDSVIDTVLVSALLIPRVFGRFSVSLDRIIGQKISDGLAETELLKTLSKWLFTNAGSIGEAFQGSDVDEVSYALGAVITSFAWKDTVIDIWDQLINPWLTINACAPEVRHLLYRGLKGLPFGKADIVEKIAKDWLDVNLKSIDASYVLAPLIGREDLSLNIDAVITQSMQWLEKYGSNADAMFVLTELLKLEEQNVHFGEVITQSMQWLEKHGSNAEARFILTELLKREDQNAFFGEVITQSMQWLEKYGRSVEAEFVLTGLLKRENLKGNDDKVITQSMQWLEKHGSNAEARFILTELLKREDQNAFFGEVITHSMQWLETHGSNEEARFVLKELLKRENLKGKDDKVITHSMKWLETHGSSAEADFVLKELLLRQDLNGHLEEVIAHSLHWLKKYGVILDAQFVLKELLKEADLRGHEEEVVIQSMQWLEKHGNSAHADFVLKELLKREDQNPHFFAVISHSMQWLEKHVSSAEADFILKELLKREDVEGNFGEVIKHSLKWLENYGCGAEAGFVLKELLKRSDLKGHEAAVIGVSMQWLEKHKSRPEARFLLTELLKREKQAESQGHMEELIKHSMLWLEQHDIILEAGFVLTELLKRVKQAELKGYKEELIKHSMQWLEEHDVILAAGFVLTELLKRVKQAESQVHKEELIKHSVRWLEKHDVSVEAEFVLTELLKRNDLVHFGADYSRLSLKWVEKHGSSLEARFVLTELLKRGELRSHEADVIGMSIQWLGNHGHIESAEFVLTGLLKRDDLKSYFEEVIKHSLQWLEKHGISAKAGFVLQSVLKRQDLDQYAELAIKYAIIWLEKNVGRDTACFVIAPLLWQKNLRINTELIIDYAIIWLEKYGLTRNAGYIFFPLLYRQDMGDKKQLIANRSCDWLRMYNNPDLKNVISVLRLLLCNTGVSDGVWRELANYFFGWLDHHKVSLDSKFIDALRDRSHCLTDEERGLLIREK